MNHIKLNFGADGDLHIVKTEHLPVKDENYSLPVSTADPNIGKLIDESIEMLMDTCTDKHDLNYQFYRLHLLLTRPHRIRLVPVAAPMNRYLEKKGSKYRVNDVVKDYRAVTLDEIIQKVT